MKNKVFLLCSITLLTVALVAVYVWQTQTADELPLTQNHASDSESLTTPATGERIKIAEGLYQVLDDGPELKQSDLGTKTVTLSDALPYGIRVIDEPVFFDTCTKRGVELPNTERNLACIPYNPEKYDEFMIFDRNEDVLYKFQTEGNYKFVSKQTGTYELGPSIFWKRGNETDGPLLQFAVSYWNDFSDLEAASSQIYYFYPKTGRLFYQSENGSETEIYLKAMSTN